MKDLPPSAEETVAHEEHNGNEVKTDTVEDKDWQQELALAHDRYLRVLADSENLKKRTAKEVKDTRRYALEGFVRDLLTVVDSFSKGFASTDETDNDAFVAGMRMVEEQFQEILNRQGLQEVASDGEFDPAVHQAIQRVETDEVQTETIKEEFAKGYTLNGRLLRPAMVSVYVPVSIDDDDKN